MEKLADIVEIGTPDKQTRLGAGDVAAVPESEAPAGARIVHVPTEADFTALAKDEPRFMKRFMNGQLTPDEVWRKFTLRGRSCFTCNNPKGAILIRVFMPFTEAWDRNSQFMLAMTQWAIAQGLGAIPTVEFGNPPVHYIRISEKVACDNCKKTAELAAARGPSWCVVEIKRGPDMNPLVAVTRNLKKA